VQLATQTSGLARLSPGFAAGAADPYAYVTPDVAERELRLTAGRPRGEDWDYSNFGFQVLSLTLERAAGAPFGSLLDRCVFQPLGMTRSGVAGHGRGNLVQGHAQGGPVPRWTRHLSRPRLADGRQGMPGSRVRQLSDLGRRAVRPGFDRTVRLPPLARLAAS